MIFFFPFAERGDAQGFAAELKRDFGLDVRFEVELRPDGGAVLHVPRVASDHRLPGGDDLIDDDYLDQVEVRWLLKGAYAADARAGARRAAIEHAIEELAEEYGGVIERLVA
jgi:hypothetical protein